MAYAPDRIPWICMALWLQSRNFSAGSCSAWSRRMKPRDESEFWDVAVQWTRPILYDTVRSMGTEYDETACLYLITARFASKSRKLIYVGKTYRQYVSKRLSQPDHLRRYAGIVANYPHHKIEVVHGLLSIENGKITEKRLSDIEKILIRSNDPTHAHNVKAFYSHGVRDSYRIVNNGYRCGLPKCISLGLFIKR